MKFTEYTLVISTFRADPLSNTLADFTNKDDAIAFVEKNGKSTFLSVLAIYYYFISIQHYTYISMFYGETLSRLITLYSFCVFPVMQPHQ